MTDKNKHVPPPPAPRPSKPPLTEDRQRWIDKIDGGVEKLERPFNWPPPPPPDNEAG